jgi:hypothetical protein
MIRAAHLVLRLRVDEVNLEPIDVGCELRQPVQHLLAPAPVVISRPVGGECLQRGQLYALRGVADQLLAGPASLRDAPTQIGQRLVGNLDVEGTDFGFAGDQSLPPWAG